MRIFKTLLLLVFVLPAYANTDIYSWTDESGERHFSDMPQEGAESVELSPTNTFSSEPPAPELGSASASLGGDESADDGNTEDSYKNFAIVAPSQEETFWNIGDGTISVGMALSPRLKPGHRIQLLMDGAPVPDYRGKSLSHTLQGPIARGQHSLQATIVDADGNPIKTAEGVTFFVQQTSVGRRPGI